jgi:hypothetical protein
MRFFKPWPKSIVAISTAKSLNMTCYIEVTEWGTSLEKAFTAFVVDNSKTLWPTIDVKKIKEVVQELGLESARFAFNTSHVLDIDEEGQWMRDQGVLHIHPTMLVAQQRFSNSTDRGPKPYPLKRIWFYENKGA